MKTIKNLTLALSFALFAMNGYAQSVSDLCKLNVENLGGESLISKVKSVTIDQTNTENNNNSSIKTIIVPGHTYYQKIKNAYGTIIVCANEDKGWFFTSLPTNTVKDMSGIEVKSNIINSKFYGPIYDYYINKDKSDVERIELVGKKNINREECYELLVTYKSGYSLTLFMSSKNYMIKKAETPTSVVNYGNYKKVKGIMIPYYVETSTVNGHMKSVVSKVRINNNINYELFVRP